MLNKNNNHPDWTIHALAYDCWFVDVDGTFCSAPPAVWQAGKVMRQLWNEMYFAFRAYCQVEEYCAAFPERCDHFAESQAKWQHARATEKDARKEWLARNKAAKATNDKAALEQAAEDFNRFRAATEAARLQHSEVFAELLAAAQQWRADFDAAQKAKPEKEREKWQPPTLRGAPRGNHYAPLLDALYGMARTYEDRLPQTCYANIANRFQTTLSNWIFKPKTSGPPRFKERMTSIRLTFRDVNGGAPASLYAAREGQAAGVWYTGHLQEKGAHLTAKGGPAKHHVEQSQEYRANGYFMLGKGAAAERLDLHVAFDRPLNGGGCRFENNPALAPDALVKEVAMVGREVRPGEWKWRIVFSVAEPPREKRPGKAVVTFDDGWRIFDEDILIAAIYDGTQQYELRLPLDLTPKRQQRFRLRNGNGQQLCIAPQFIWEMEAKQGALLQACKEKLKTADKSGWPDEARQTMTGIVKMRDKGLLHLRYQLAQAGVTEPAIEEWLMETSPLFKAIRGNELQQVRSRNELYRLSLAWIVKQCRCVVIDTLKIKEKAMRPCRKKEKRKQHYEETGVWEHRTVADRIEENAQRWRHYVALSEFNNWLRWLCRKHGVEIIERTHDNHCSECGKPIDFQERYAAACPDGHWRRKNSNSARALWEDLGVTDSAPLDFSTISPQAKRLIDVPRTISDGANT